MDILIEKKDSRILREIIAYVAGATHSSAESIDINLQFKTLGLDSASAVKLVAELGNFLNKKLSPTLPWEYTTPLRLAEHLSGESPKRAPQHKDIGHLNIQNEQIAIIGMACRFPGAKNLKSFWDLLISGQDAITEIPAERWSIDKFYDSDPDAPGKMKTKYGNFIEDIDKFDPSYFGISPREAIEMDPQQRLALELSWEAIHDAGIKVNTLHGTNVAVYFGATWNDYVDVGSDVPVSTPYRATGVALNMIANRVSYILGIHGPSLVIDTACSSSLVAIHTACQNLRSGQSKMAIVGGVNLMISPRTMASLSKTLGLAEDGKCKAFSEDADGPGRGEGGGCIILKPLADAIRHGDRVYAVIRSSVVNNDGHSNGLTAPDRKAQEQMLIDAYQQADIPTKRVHYVEAHGTGTRLGDPIEAGALGATLGFERMPGKELLIGSVKTNIGHLEPAAGMAGIIKTVLAMEKRQIPPSLHAERLNPIIDFDQLGIKVVRKAQPWPAQDYSSAYSGVSSFGWGGVNSHVVLESPPKAPRLLMVGAGSKSELLEKLKILREQINDPTSHQQVHLEYESASQSRFASWGRTRVDLLDAIDSFVGGKPDSRYVYAENLHKKLKITFICSPGGGQWVGMARKIFRSEPVFRNKFIECDNAIYVYSNWSLVDKLFEESKDTDFDSIEFLAPLVFAVQVALNDLWRSWGIVPDNIVGHSVGEVAAAYISGLLDMENAALAAWGYASIPSLAEGIGGMAYVKADTSTVQRILQDTGGILGIAAENSNRTMIVSGETSALNKALNRFKEQNIECGLIRVNFAAHSEQMQPLADMFESKLANIKARNPVVRLISTVTGKPLNKENFNSRYFASNLTEQVQYKDTISRLIQEGTDSFVELCPHPIILDATQECIQELKANATVLPSLSMSKDERLTIYESRARLFVAGATPARDRLNILMLSAKSEKSVKLLAENILEELKDADGQRVQNIAYTLASRRDHHSYRIAVTGHSGNELCTQLQIRLRQHGRITKSKETRPVFVYSGQGSQWFGMGARLLNAEPVFRRAVEECEDLVWKYGGLSIIKILDGSDDSIDINNTSVTQPAIFAMQYALTKLWNELGVWPSAVIGHSIGEISAVHTAGIISLEDAIRLACVRGKSMANASDNGRMLSVSIGHKEAFCILQQLNSAVEIAAYNDPGSVVFSGDENDIGSLNQALEKRGFKTRILRVKYAFHSKHMAVHAKQLPKSLNDLQLGTAKYPIYSTVSGAIKDGLEFNLDHWVDNIVNPVKFHQAIDAAISDGHRLFLEVGAHPVLVGNISETLMSRGVEGDVINSLHREKDVYETLYPALQVLYEHGASINIAPIYKSGDCVSLPVYPWDKKSYWLGERTGIHNRHVESRTNQVSLLNDIDVKPQSHNAMLNVSKASQQPNNYEDLYQLVMDEIVIISRLDPSNIEETSPFMSLGIDSHMGIELRNRLMRKFSIELDATLIWAYPYMQVLVQFLMQKLSHNQQDANSHSMDEKKLGSGNKPQIGNNYLDRAAEVDLTLLSDEEKENLLDEALSKLDID